MAPNNISKDKLADLWKEQSNKLWRAVYATPLIAVAVLAGWYSVFSLGQKPLASLVLVVGLFAMFIQFAVVFRMAQYDAAFFKTIKNDLPPIPKPIFPMNGKQLAVSVPVLMTVVLMLLLVFTIAGPGLTAGEKVDVH